MATTLTLQSSINFTTPFLKNQPEMVSNLEPAVGGANIILGMMLGAPCRWRFNRGTLSFPITAAGGTDYVVSVPDLGFIETAWLKDSNGKIWQLNGKLTTAKESNESRPTLIAPVYDDNAGNITFRLTNAPTANYTVYVDYQKKMTLMTSPASVWGVVPDEFNYIFNQGFLGMMMILVNDSRFPIFMNYFVTRLLLTQDGLSDQEKNIFLQDFAQFTATLLRTQGMVAAANADRTK